MLEKFVHKNRTEVVPPAISASQLAAGVGILVYSARRYLQLPHPAAWGCLAGGLTFAARDRWGRLPSDPTLSLTVDRAAAPYLLPRERVPMGAWIPIERLFGLSRDERLLAESRHMLYNAIDRVFQARDRSILEILINALDASQPEFAVGQFGMGFFASLGFVQEGSILTVRTTTEDQSYTLTIANSNQGVVVCFDEMERLPSTGTVVTITPPKGRPFDRHRLEGLRRYAMYLQTLKRGSFHLDGRRVGEGPETGVRVSFEPGSLTIRDGGSGISLSVAQEKLLVPSASTKKQAGNGEAKPLPPESIFWEGKGNPSHSHLLLAINEVVCLIQPLAKPLLDKNGRAIDLVIHLPQSTPLTTARDAVVWRGADSPQSVQLRKSIESIVAGALKEAALAPRLNLLYRGLCDWEEHVEAHLPFSPSKALQAMLLQGLADRPDLLPIPLATAAPLTEVLERALGELPFQPLPIDSDLISHRWSESVERLRSELSKRDMSPLERRGLEGELIEKTAVYFVDGIQGVRDFDLPQVLFADKKLLRGSTTAKSLGWKLHTLYAVAGKKLVTPELPADFRPPPPMVPSELQPPIYLTNHQGDVKGVVDKEAIIQMLVEPEMLFPELSDEQLTRVWEELVKRNAPSCMVVFGPRQLWIKVDDLEIPFPGYRHVDSERVKIILIENEKEEEQELPCHTVLRILLRSLSIRYGLGNGHFIRTVDGTTLWPTQEGRRDEEAITLFSLLAFHRLKSDFTKGVVVHPIESDADRALRSIAPFIATLEPHFRFFSPGTAYATEKRTCSDPKHTGFAPLAARLYGQPLLLHMMLESGRFSPPQVERLKGLSDTALGLYCDQLQRIAVSRARNGKGAMSYFAPFNVVTTPSQKIIDLIGSLATPPHLFNRLADLTEEALSNVHSEETKRLTRFHRFETLATLHSTRELSMLHFQGADEYIRVILDNVQTAAQLDYITSYVHKKILERVVPENLPPEICEPCSPSVRRELFIWSVQNGRIDLQSLPLRDGELPSSFREWLVAIIHEQLIGEEISRNEVEEWHRIERRRSLLEPESWKDLDLSFTKIVEGESRLTIHPTFAEPSGGQNDMTARPILASQLLCGLRSGDGLPTDLLDRGSLRKWLDHIRSLDQESELMMITQAAERGSERSAAQAAVVELGQNSADARSPKVDYSVDVLRSNLDDPGQLILSVSDEVGFTSLKSLCYDLLMPNVSQKGAEHVGEMGNGSFQIYSGAEGVTFLTRPLSHPEQVYLLHVTPIRSEGEVHDLEVRIDDVTEQVDPTFKGTRVRILFNSAGADESQMKVDLSAFHLQSYIRQTLGGAHYPLEGDESVAFHLDGKPISYLDRKKRPFIHDGKVPFELRATKTPLEKGWVYIGGIPLSPLNTFLADEELLDRGTARIFSRGWILNLPLGCCQRIQCGTRVRLMPPAKEELRTFITNALYWQIIESKASGRVTRYPDPVHLHSHQKYRQVRPEPPKQKGQRAWNEKVAIAQEDDIVEFITHYRPPWQKRSLCEELADAYLSWVPQVEKVSTKLYRAIRRKPHKRAEITTQALNVIKDLFGEWKQAAIAECQNERQELLFTTLLFPWLEKKISSSLQMAFSAPRIQESEVSAAGELKAKAAALFERERIEAKQLLHMIDDALTAYCQLLLKTNRTETNGLRASIAPLKKAISGRYKPCDNTIQLNVSHFPVDQLLWLLAGIVRGAPLTRVPLASELFWPHSSAPGTLNHELEHAFRHLNGRAEADFHADGIDPEGNIRTFDDCAAARARLAHGNGLFIRWQAIIQQGLEGREASCLTRVAAEITKWQEAYGPKPVTDLLFGRSQQG